MEQGPVPGDCPARLAHRPPCLLLSIPMLVPTSLLCAVHLVGGERRHCCRKAVVLSVCSQASRISLAWERVRHAEPRAPLSPAQPETEGGSQQPAGAGPPADSDAPQSLRATVLDYRHFDRRGSTLSSELPCSRSPGARRHLEC